MTPQAMPKRAALRQESGPFMPFTFGSTASFGMRTSSRMSSLVTLARRLIFLWMRRASKPFVSVGTRKPRTSLASLFAPPTFAQTSATCARLPFVIQRFVPLSTHESPSSIAFVRMPDGFEPWSGSVRPKQPMISPFAIFGR